MSAPEQRLGAGFSILRCARCGQTMRAISRSTTVCTSIKRAFCATVKRSLPCSPCGRISRFAWRISARRLSATARTTAVSCSRLRPPSMRILRRTRCSPVCTRPCRASPTRLQTHGRSKSNSSTMCSAIKPPRLRPKAVFPVRIRMTWNCYWMVAVPLPSARRDRCGPAHCRLNSPSVSCSSTRTASIRCCCSTTCSASLTAAVRTLCSTAYRRVRS